MAVCCVPPLKPAVSAPAGPVLIPRPPAPQTIPPCSLPAPGPCEPSLPLASSGLATAGFRTAKYLLDEWKIRCQAGFAQAFADRDSSERGRYESKRLAAETEASSQRSQAGATRALGERLQDLHFWRSELCREIGDLTSETDLLVQQKRRLERAMDASEVLATIASDNLQCRERRLGPDLVRDQVEEELLRELELVRNVQELLKRTLEQTVMQIRLNRDAKQTLEMDWSDKVEAYDIDDKCGRYNNQSTEIQFHLNSSKFEDNASTPESWAQFSHDNICKAEHERMASINLRTLIDNILQDTAEDLRMQAAAVDKAFAKRCEEVEDAKRKLENQLSKTLEEIAKQEMNIASLKQAIKDKQAPLKVAQTRLYQRTHRPNVELCKDAVQFRLVNEVAELTESICCLQQQLEESEQALINMEDTRLSFVKEIAIKANSLFIDREKCMAHRTRYPTLLRLTGYQ
ncbi:tektin-4 [Ambystoma mexicanum]|uniref:tektin-4 n=1 Tax=Ambystoma mexicanum TaxID=8296 RepID=UPI0037E74556